jgi:hypothetical protein
VKMLLHYESQKRRKEKLVAFCQNLHHIPIGCNGHSLLV